MVTSKFKIENKKIKRIDEVPIVGDLNVDTFSFEFDSEWEGLTKTILFIKDDKKHLDNLIDDEIVLPNMVYGAGDLLFGLYGKQGNQVICSTPLYSITVLQSAYSESDNPDNLPDETTWDRYTQIMLSLVAEGQLTLAECNQVLESMRDYYENTKAEIEEIRDATEGYKNDAQEILQDVEDVKQDIIDMGASRTFATFYLDAKTGKLYVVNAESLGNMGFFIQDGKLYVSMKTEVE